MGMRANLIVITERGREIYYSHWGGAGLPFDLFWGPADATAFARQQRSEAEGAELLDDKWGESAAIIDHTTKTLLWFGGEDLDTMLPRRRVLLGMMKAFWPDWTIRWAFEGITEVADYLGVGRDMVLSTKLKREETKDASWVFETAPDDTFINVVISCRRGGACRFFATSEHVPDVLPLGNALIERLATELGPMSFDWGARTTGFPSGGLHVDFDERTLGFWHTGPSPAIGSRGASLFAGWAVAWWRDEYENHVREAPGLLLPRWDEGEEMRFLLRCLLHEAHDNSSMISELTPQVLAAKAIAANIHRFSDASPFALRYDPMLLSAGERRQRLVDAFGAVVDEP